ncbi:helix-turn-helix transcriptional regulator [Glaciimonas immobilis]|uniref:Transcriptional regulator with XRE-family HTH domain n=1 Tax=Glaciimonas immobilis TaxID=728004 RepID=A0A840RRX8_9BURK|nr:helix-turn-helix transcriptional regulator [Glaciimonas immobilis]KAF3996428.1 helix-turn-helix domain-containing protein [Glaciimonas immobilis]MBB5201237.1 transcriptional regulator with XRE-family HTH domain [Glaciimonas immobilis]
MDELSKRKALGDFIKSQRSQIAPMQLAIGTTTRRRTPGLRREEVAQLCDISVTWYTWIEQGRTVSVSPQALARIADALRLPAAKRSYLFKLSGKEDPQLPGIVDDQIPTDVIALLRKIKSPAYLLDRYWDVVAWNRSAQTLFSGWLDQKSQSKNILLYTFCEPAALTFISDWELRAPRLVAEFRADCGMRLDEPKIMALVERMCAGSSAFKRAWNIQDVTEKEGGERRFNHPTLGTLSYQQVNLRVANRPELKLVVLLQG